MFIKHFYCLTTERTITLWVGLELDSEQTKSTGKRINLLNEIFYSTAIHSLIPT